MKKLIWFLSVMILFQACEDTSTNTPALQANIDTSFFKTNAANAVVDANDSSVTITGLSVIEQLILHTSSGDEGTYNLSPFGLNYASFIDREGNIHSTDTEGSSGKIRITFMDEQNNELTGDFEFTSIRPGLDTIAVYGGYFYRVPYTIGL